MEKVWLITGCSRGLGRALAEEVLESGGKLVATARSVEDLEFLPRGENLRKVPLDVTDAASAQAAVETAISEFGRLDIVVNNAGVASGNSIEDQSEGEFRRQFETNFFGAYHIAHAALPALHKQRSGHIIFVASIGARACIPGFGSYQAAKAAVASLSETLSQEVGPLGIRVICAEPGGMRTDMFDSSIVADVMTPDYEETIGKPIRSVFGDPDNATSDPRKVAAAILRVAREDEPPVRLLLGSDAFKRGTEVFAARLKEDQKWKELSTSTDY